MGIRFDIVISSYVIILPALLLMALQTTHQQARIIRKIIFYWLFLFFSIFFLIAAADIPYFNQFFDRFSVGAFEWLDNIGVVFSMIIEEPKYFLIIIPYIVFELVFYFLLKKIFNKKPVFKSKKRIFLNSFISLLTVLIIFIGIRGRIDGEVPIRIGYAYFCNNSFLNKLGLNPVFTLMRSVIDQKQEQSRKLQLINEGIALNKIKKNLKIDKPLENSLIARRIIPDTIWKNKPNIILILMESMSIANLKQDNNKNELTPFLDSISQKSLFFNNIYSAGKHTYNGIFSTLFSYPALYREHTFKQLRKYNGISHTLKKHGYSTTYFTTHGGQFDNVEGFLRFNHFDNIFTQKDYPAKEIKTAYGVPDDFMFRYAIPQINKLAEKNKPFFITFMTTSNHGPYYTPAYFKSNNKNKVKKAVEYADWSLKQFILSSKKEFWFDNTIFVLIADHGVPLDANYDIALNYFHIPLIFYSPKLLKQKKYLQIGSQLDVYPTLMGLINAPYINNSLGIDLLKTKRPYAILNDDDKIGIIDSTYFCIMKKNMPLRLYKYKNKEKINYFKTNKEKAFEMEEFAKINMQTYQNMLINKTIYFDELKE
jgi:phosphoglycerol transferase MdoB-like AlkP superfamily enzyme